MPIFNWTKIDYTNSEVDILASSKTKKQEQEHMSKKQVEKYHSNKIILSTKQEKEPNIGGYSNMNLQRPFTSY